MIYIYILFQQTAELIDLKPDPNFSTPTSSTPNSKPAVSFHTVLDAPPGFDGRRLASAEYKQSRRSGNWKNIFSIPSVKQSAPQLLRSMGGSRSSHRDLRASHKEIRGSHREINIDEAAMMLPENKPLNYRPRPKSELNLSYSVQVRSCSIIFFLFNNLVVP